MVKTMKNNYEQELKRLVALAGTDEGFYLLALHAFIEGYCNTLKPGFTLYAKFNEVIDLLLDMLEVMGISAAETRRPLIRLAKEHDLANRVRHQFQRLTAEEAAAATYNFLGFCKDFGIEGMAVDQLRESLSMWKRRCIPVEIMRELENSRRELGAVRQEASAMMRRIQDLQGAESNLASALSRIKTFEAEIEALRKTAETRGKRVDELRKGRHEAREERDRAVAELAANKDIDAYMRYLERFGHYTRTRLDYERSVLSLSGEQEEAVSMIREAGDYVIKGAAGTGKTLVLLHALERFLKDPQHRLGFTERGNPVLLTYTNTLVKYSRYLAEIVGRSGAVPHVSTADSFLLSLLKAIIDKRAAIDFKAPWNDIHDYNTTGFFTDEELAVELENIIWGNAVTREEYLEEGIIRRGARQPLNKDQRRAVWEIQERLMEKYTGKLLFSRSAAAVCILEYIERGVFPIDSCEAERIYVDESQDLPAAIIRVFRNMSRSGLVAAADDVQSIYRIGSHYLRAGLNVIGHVRILRTNFRNTRQIYNFAEWTAGRHADCSSAGSWHTESNSAGAGSGYQSVDPAQTAAEETPVFGIETGRIGPEPEVVCRADERELMESLALQLKIVLGRLGYDPENVGILAPTNDDLVKIKARLATETIRSANIREKEFDFLEPDIVRLSTLHSSKGLEFPVVLLYLPRLPQSEEYDEKSTIRLQNSLLYVAMTRAMDYLVVFVLDNPADKVIAHFLESAKSAPLVNVIG